MPESPMRRPVHAASSCRLVRSLLESRGSPHRSEGELRMADGAKVVINLATGLEDPERVTVAFLVGGAATEQGKQVAMFLTKEAVRLAVPRVAEVVACDGCPPLSRLLQQYAENGGELFVC